MVRGSGVCAVCVRCAMPFHGRLTNRWKVCRVTSKPIARQSAALNSPKNDGMPQQEIRVRWCGCDARCRVRLLKTAGDGERRTPLQRQSRNSVAKRGVYRQRTLACLGAGIRWSLPHSLQGSAVPALAPGLSAAKAGKRLTNAFFTPSGQRGQQKDSLLEVPHQTFPGRGCHGELRSLRRRPRWASLAPERLGFPQNPQVR